MTPNLLPQREELPADPIDVEMPLEDVIAKYGSKERKRSDLDSDKQERAIAVTYRRTIAGLDTSFQRVAKDSGLHGTGLQIVQRCMSHHILSWYSTLPAVRELTELYNNLLYQADDNGFNDVGKWIKQTYQFDLLYPTPVDTESGITSASTFGRCHNALHSLSQKTGIAIYLLYSIGFAWSVSTNQRGWSNGSIARHFKPEVEHLKNHLEERLMYLQFCQNVVNRRLLSEKNHTTT